MRSDIEVFAALQHRHLGFMIIGSISLYVHRRTWLNHQAAAVIGGNHGGVEGQTHAVSRLQVTFPRT